MAWTDFFSGNARGSFTEEALRLRQEAARKQREEDAYRANYKGPIMTQGQSHSPVGDLVSSGLEWLGLGSKGAYDFGQKIDKAADALTPYGPMKKVHEGDFAGAAESLVGGPSLAMAAAPAKKAVEGIGEATRAALAEAKSGIKAYHGSPHSFDQFDLSKIGTGEGAQAYGHGLYFAENEGVAKNYRDALTTRDQGAGDAVGAAYKSVASDNGFLTVKGQQYSSPERVLRDITAGHLAPDDLPPELASAVKKYVSPGSLYEVNINADPNAFLDWDKPLSEQGQSVQDALAKTGARIEGKDPTGSEAWLDVVSHHGLLREGAKVPASNAMKQAGIPGIKYLDQGSRGAADGSRNYVVFDDKLVQIVKKYGIAAAVGAGLVWPMMAEQMRRQGVIEEQS